MEEISEGSSGCAVKQLPKITEVLLDFSGLPCPHNTPANGNDEQVKEGSREPSKRTIYNAVGGPDLLRAFIATDDLQHGAQSAWAQSAGARPRAGIVAAPVGRPMPRYLAPFVVPCGVAAAEGKVLEQRHRVLTLQPMVWRKAFSGWVVPISRQSGCGGGKDFFAGHTPSGLLEPGASLRSLWGEPRVDLAESPAPQPGDLAEKAHAGMLEEEYDFLRQAEAVPASTAAAEHPPSPAEGAQREGRKETSQVRQKDSCDAAADGGCFPDYDAKLRAWFMLSDSAKTRWNDLEAMAQRFRVNAALADVLPSTASALSDSWLRHMLSGELSECSSESDELTEDELHSLRVRRAFRQKLQRLELAVESVPRRLDGEPNSEEDYALRRLNISCDSSQKYSLQEEEEDSELEHSVVAQELRSEFFRTRLDEETLASLHRPRAVFAPFKKVTIYYIPPDERGEALLEHLPGLSSSELRLSSARTVKSVDGLSALIHELLVLEYVERQPLLLSNVGMASRIKNYLLRSDKHRGTVPVGDVGQRTVDLLSAHGFSVPFLSLSPDKLATALENNLFKTQIYRQDAPSTDFLLIARQGQSQLPYLPLNQNYKPVLFYLRPLPRLFLAGHQQPQMMIPEPRSGPDKETERLWIWVHLNRLFRDSVTTLRDSFDGEVRSLQGHHLKLDAFRSLFGDTVKSSTLRSVLHTFADFHRGEFGWWTMRPGYLFPTELQLRARLPPERVCLHESTHVGNYRLSKLFYDNNVAFIQCAADRLCNPKNADRRSLEVSLKVQRKLSQAPWWVSRNFISASLGADTAVTAPLFELAKRFLSEPELAHYRALCATRSSPSSASEGVAPCPSLEVPFRSPLPSRWSKLLAALFHREGEALISGKPYYQTNFASKAEDDTDVEGFDELYESAKDVFDRPAKEKEAVPSEEELLNELLGNLSRPKPAAVGASEPSASSSSSTGDSGAGAGGEGRPAPGRTVLVIRYGFGGRAPEVVRDPAKIAEYVQREEFRKVLNDDFIAASKKVRFDMAADADGIT
eukprot:RCo039783